MRILLAAIPFLGHVNPVLAAARLLRDAGHVTGVYTGELFRDRVVAAGLEFFSLPKRADPDMRDLDIAFPGRSNYAPGLPQLLFDMQAVHIDPMLSQYEGLRVVLRDFKPDLVIHETGFCGMLPFLLGQRAARPASACLGVTTLRLPRADGAPIGPGLMPPTGAAQRSEYAALARHIDASLTDPVRELLDKALASIGLKGVPAPIFESTSILADVMLQPGGPSFEFPLRDSQPKLRFVGALPTESYGDVPPQLQEAKSADRSVVLVSQGTVANQNLDKLIVPSMEALGGREELLILVTTGGRATDTISSPLSENAIAMQMVDFNRVLPQVDVMVAFGGYGTVIQALAAGVPLVLAGLTEDKPEIAARVEWSGSGIYLRTDNPTAEQLKTAVDRVLCDRKFDDNAKRLSAEFCSIDARFEIDKAVK